MRSTLVFSISLLCGCNGGGAGGSDGRAEDLGAPTDGNPGDAAEVADFATARADAVWETDGAAPADASAIACPNGSTLLFDRTACPGAPPVAGQALTDAVSTGVRGEIVGLAGLAVGATPCVPVLVCRPDDAATLLFSDDPESPAGDGVLYADTIGPGNYRVFVYHVNGGDSLRKFPVVLLNPGGAPVHASVVRRGAAGPGSDYIGVGKAAAASWMAGAVGQTVTVPPATRVLFDADLDGRHAAKNDLVHAIIDFTLDGTVKLSVVSVGAAADAARVTAGLSLLHADGLHDRGTFPGADLLLAATAPLDGAGVRRLALGDGVTDVSLSGVVENDSIPRQFIASDEASLNELRRRRLTARRGCGHVGALAGRRSGRARARPSGRSGDRPALARPRARTARGGSAL